MASTKRELSLGPEHDSKKLELEHESKKAKLELPPEPEFQKAEIDATEPDSPKSTSSQLRVTLNPTDCSLDFDIEQDGLQGSGLHEEGFAYCWSGARANVGITGGKYCFSCKIVSVQPVNMEDTPPDQQYVCRLGISRGDDAVGNLGETPHSFGFGGTGKFSSAGKFSDYGEKFGVGDTIKCCVDLESKPLACIGFSQNGKWLGFAKVFDAGPRGLEVVDSPIKELQWESALFPHVLLKNVMVQLQFSVEDGLVPEEGYKPWASALDDGNAIMGPNSSDMRDCEVMMMVGLPASGKTTWAEKWIKEHPEKRYVLLGTNLILDQMKVSILASYIVPGLLRKQNYGERFDRLMGRANAIFDTLLSRASKTPRNYIIDQTNVFKNARKRKLRPFSNFRKIAVVVFPKPEELKFRADKRFKEMGTEVPFDAVSNMLANYVLPTSKDMPGSDELFDQVNIWESQKHLEEMKHALKTKTLPCSRQTSIELYARSPMQNQGALPVCSGSWQSSHPPPPLLCYGYQNTNPAPPSSNYGYQNTNLPPPPLNDGCQKTNQGFGSSLGAYQSYQSPSIPRALVPDTTCASSEPRNNSGYSWNFGAISGGRADSCQNYGSVDPYGRADTVGEKSVVGAAATSDPYWSNMTEPSPGGGLPYGSPCFPLSASPTPSPRPPYANFPAGMQQHSGRYNPRPPRYY
ncbi:unnamed protein product [Dovyalis caffra]|uniref:SPRY domain-containing protein n=1 Tax=Dovyalis caffra TaxID=77055 RepID=A0AAV1SKC8_9ROSI|nr:unnamed protein product [Dovyalis caffra]